MDRMPVCGTCDPGSIPGESTNGRPICASIWVVAVCSSHQESNRGVTKSADELGESRTTPSGGRTSEQGFELAK